MAIEFGSRKETFDNFKVYETMLAGRPFKVEMGKMCGLSNASALIRYGETCVMCNVVMSPLQKILSVILLQFLPIKQAM